MRLTDFTDYSLRALMYLAVCDDRLATIDGIARAYDVPKNHMSKIIQRLSANGWVESVRGRQGGVRLAKHARTATVGAIVREMEADFALARCHTPDGHCAIAPHCRLKYILSGAQETFLASLDTCTLEDLVTPAAPLASVFRLVRLNVPESVNVPGSRA
jgi:Rrf2 family nitric oxide-sensitive transcriptional repressor